MSPSRRGPRAALLLAAALPPTSARLTNWLQHSFLSRGGGESCAPLKNRGSHFTVEIAVGTPPQSFDVVADTGSDSVIVNSCMCVDSGRCSKEDRCFRGIKHSSSFSLEGVADHGNALKLAAEAKVPTLVITFGSGQIEALVASDVVKVGSAEATMDKSLLLLVDKALEFGGPFEGILGLGLPRHNDTELEKQAEKSGQSREQIEKMSQMMDQRGFLQTAGIDRFSMCFNGEGKDGVLRLVQEKPELQLGSVGTVHWGLGLTGVSVVPSKAGAAKEPSFISLGRAAAEAGEVKTSFCDPSNMKEGQETPCGAIPDSGTTLIMGPPEQLIELFLKVCDAWPKCANGNAEEKPLKRFQSLLQDCENWLDKDSFSDLPVLKFHLEGAGGAKTTVDIHPDNYIMEYVVDEVKYVKKHLAGVFDVVAEVPTGKQVKVCSPAFGTQNFNTVKNGPVWILGTPVFYDYQVGYDLKATPPAISFVNDACGTCEDNKPAFLSQKREVQEEKRARRQGPWTLSGPIRVAPLDTSGPL